MPALLEVLVYRDAYAAVVLIVCSRRRRLVPPHQIGRPRVDVAAEDVAVRRVSGVDCGQLRFRCRRGQCRLTSSARRRLRREFPEGGGGGI